MAHFHHCLGAQLSRDLRDMLRGDAKAERRPHPSSIPADQLHGDSDSPAQSPHTGLSISTPDLPILPDDAKRLSILPADLPVHWSALQIVVQIRSPTRPASDPGTFDAAGALGAADPSVVVAAPPLGEPLLPAERRRGELPAEGRGEGTEAGPTADVKIAVEPDAKTPIGGSGAALRIDLEGAGTELGANQAAEGAQNVMVVVSTPRGGTISWRPTDPEPPSSLFTSGNELPIVQWFMVSDQGPASMSAVLRAAITDKRRFVVFRRFWWHKIRQLSVAQELSRRAAETPLGKLEKVSLGPFMWCIMCALRGRSARLALLSSMVLVALAMAVCILVLLPLWLAGAIQASLPLVMSPCLVGLNLALAQLSGGLFYRLVRSARDGPKSALDRLERSAYCHRSAAIRLALFNLGALSSETVDRVAPSPARLTHWQLASEHIDELSWWFLAYIGACVSVVLVIVKAGGGLGSWSWQGVFAFATVLMALNLGATLIRWALVRCGGPRLDAHAEQFLGVKLIDAGTTFNALLFAQLILLGRQADALDAGDSLPYSWAAAMAPLWISAALHLAHWWRPRVRSVGRYVWCLPVLYAAWAACVVTFEALLCAHLSDRFAVSSVALLWTPLWISFPLFLCVAASRFLRLSS